MLAFTVYTDHYLLCKLLNYMRTPVRTPAPAIYSAVSFLFFFFLQNATDMFHTTGYLFILYTETAVFSQNSKKNIVTK